MSTLMLDGHKLLWHQERVAALLRGERVAPITIDCALTRKCNYRCVYCYGQLQANDEKKMTREVIFRFLDDAAEIGVKAISLVSDGESTCSPYWADAIIHGRANGLDMAIGTNGYLFDNGRMEEVLPCLTYLRFNISAGQRGRYAEIHGCREACFDHVCETIRKAVTIKQAKGLPVTIGLQMVLMPEFLDQVMPLMELGRELGVDYLVIKHCSDDEEGRLGVDYQAYFQERLIETLKTAEACSTEKYQVSAKWSKLLSGGTRCYDHCFGPPLILQMSGSGLVAPCGMLFNDRYKQFHIGNITETPFKELWQSDRYWDVMNHLASDRFNARTMCGTLCLQHKVNEFLYQLETGQAELPEQPSETIPHVNFI